MVFMRVKHLVKGKNLFVFLKELFIQIWGFFSIFPRKRSTKKENKSAKKRGAFASL
jgi:hypothetical protein